MRWIRCDRCGTIDVVRFEVGGTPGLEKQSSGEGARHGMPWTHGRRVSWPHRRASGLAIIISSAKPTERRWMMHGVLDMELVAQSSLSPSLSTLDKHIKLLNWW